MGIRTPLIRMQFFRARGYRALPENASMALHSFHHDGRGSLELQESNEYARAMQSAHDVSHKVKSSPKPACNAAALMKLCVAERLAPGPLKHNAQMMVDCIILNHPAPVGACAALFRGSSSEIRPFAAEVETPQTR